MLIFIKITTQRYTMHKYFNFTGIFFMLFFSKPLIAANDDFYYLGLKVGYFDLGADSDLFESSISYGVQGIYLNNTNWGLSFSHTLVDIETNANIDINADHTGIGLIYGKALENEGKKSASYIGYEYTLSSDLNDGHSVIGGFIFNINKNISLGISGRYEVSNDGNNNPYEVSTSIGYTF